MRVSLSKFNISFVKNIASERPRSRTYVKVPVYEGSEIKGGWLPPKAYKSSICLHLAYKFLFLGIPKSGLQDILSPTTLNHTKLQCWQVMTVGMTKPQKEASQWKIHNWHNKAKKLSRQALETLQSTQKQENVIKIHTTHCEWDQEN